MVVAVMIWSRHCQLEASNLSLFGKRALKEYCEIADENTSGKLRFRRDKVRWSVGEYPVDEFAVEELCNAVNGFAEHGVATD